MSALDEFLNTDDEWLDGTDTHELGEKYYYGVKEAAAEYTAMREALEAAIHALRAVVHDRPTAHSDKVWSEVNRALAKLEALK